MSNSKIRKAASSDRPYGQIFREALLSPDFELSPTAKLVGFCLAADTHDREVSADQGLIETLCLHTGFGVPQVCSGLVELFDQRLLTERERRDPHDDPRFATAAVCLNVDTDLNTKWLG
jgi:hypothetical protein